MKLNELNKVSGVVVDSSMEMGESFLSVYSAGGSAYLKMANLSLGVLINFNTLRLVDGIKR